MIFGLILLVPISASAKTLCTIIADPAKSISLLEEGNDCHTRVTPASTTKIPLAVMGFDSGFLKTPHTPNLPFQEGYVDWLGDVWKQPTDPTRWLKYSVVWYSQLLAHHLGQERLENYAADFGFGNADFSGDPGKMNGLERAWISSSLKISPHEQISFLTRLVQRDLPVEDHVYDKVYQSIEMFSESDGWRIYGKTGMAFPKKANGKSDLKRAYGWFVGWAQKNKRTIVFARLLQDKAGYLRKNYGSPSQHARDTLIKILPQHIQTMDK